MPTYIDECISLVENKLLSARFETQAAKIRIETNPAKILFGDDLPVSLWAQSRRRVEVLVDMTLSGVQRFLKSLADHGVGGGGEHGGVRYRFVEDTKLESDLSTQ
ncbi:predicted protein [Chaetomium globosum CBS 148.51]|uniref:Uncharacterized protein n=1 Tax=Chaetomium globosum (strain ATCC 6205 / CBS 148.51 / DSM 1962 / NBRC 6347 / NRRL 1970) TaxID=306901 RepID=Q2GSN5_CHAGB|nr:uncharacterized protein CHGG_09019 [Chaetomium globosum CBS 148.51]EAQ85005.1 predicted protein [Chaetomium globosum CBS 148.51]